MAIKIIQRIPLSVLVMLCFSVSLSVFRVAATGSAMYLFLNWNLFLATIPWLLSEWILRHKSRISPVMLWISLVTWLLFFPNCPYILTDLFHLKKSYAMPLWYDLILILSYAWTALIIGFSSWRKIEQVLIAQWGRSTTGIITFFVFLSAGFGVYLGRYLRWNTWDILYNPSLLWSDISHRLVAPSEHPYTWGLTLLLGIFLHLMYSTLKQFRSEIRI